MFSPQIRVRVIISLVMLLLGLLGVVLTTIEQDGAWYYWHILTIVYAVMSMGLSSHLKKNKWKVTGMTLWHELFHWLGVWLCIVLLSFLVHLGFIGRFVASIEMLILLALATYLAGIYTEPIFIPLGVLLGLAAAVMGLFQVYLYMIIIPAAVIAGCVIFWVIRRSLREERGKDVR